MFTKYVTTISHSKPYTVRIKKKGNPYSKAHCFKVN